MQVHEMVYIEKGGAEQIEQELEAYNPLIPKGQELVATFMIEIDDPDPAQSAFSAALAGSKALHSSRSAASAAKDARKPIRIGPATTEKPRRFSSSTSR